MLIVYAVYVLCKCIYVYTGVYIRYIYIKHNIYYIYNIYNMYIYIYILYRYIYLFLLTEYNKNYFFLRAHFFTITVIDKMLVDFFSF